MEFALKNRSVMMRGVTCANSDTKMIRLGRTVYAELEFEGCRVKGLIDTGSPATIVCLDYLLHSLAKGHPKIQTPTEWVSAMRR